MSQASFYDSLSSLEKTYWHKLSEVFQLVAAQKPEKGIETLLLRARKAAEQNGTTLAQELETVFQGAQERTLRRMELLGACQLPKPSDK
ncbi:MAG TPA: hypothetical protein VIG33_02440 [Pseudobdellovibrionaceae bacterium]|jgi:hypothetical protein